MKKRKSTHFSASAFHMFAVFFTLMCCLLIIETSQSFAEQSPAARNHEYAIYLSPGFEKGDHWGGYHVTITGFSNMHASGKSEKNEAKKAWYDANGGKPYSFANKKLGKDYGAVYLGSEYGWSIEFYSNTLDQLAKELNGKGFKNVRNAKGSKNHKWHISLYCKTKNDAINKFETYLKNKPWYLFEVRKPSSDCQKHGTNCDKTYWNKI
jgi:hypothetical protein